MFSHRWGFSIIMPADCTVRQLGLLSGGNPSALWYDSGEVTSVAAPPMENDLETREQMTTDIHSLIEQLTLEEKAALCTGASAWTTTPVSRLGVPEFVVTDGPHGVRRVPDNHALAAASLPATCFPTASALALTWDVALLHEMGASPWPQRQTPCVWMYCSAPALI